jgi:insertion element IS1 protein InsB
MARAPQRIDGHHHLLPWEYVNALARKTNHVERFNCTLRQRVSRLVRSTLSFSKKLANHIGAIKSFICDYNLTKCVALPG